MKSANIASSNFVPVIDFLQARAMGTGLSKEFSYNAEIRNIVSNGSKEQNERFKEHKVLSDAVINLKKATSNTVGVNWKEIGDAVTDIFNNLLGSPDSAVFFKINHKKLKLREYFASIGGIDELLILISPSFSSRYGKDVFEKRVNIWNMVLVIFREIFYAIPSTASLYFSKVHMYFLFQMLSSSSVFDISVSLIEVIIGAKTEVVDLTEVPNIVPLIKGFTIRQLAIFCRVLSLVLFEPEDRIVLESVKDIGSLELLQVRRDRMSKQSSAVEHNQNFLISLSLPTAKTTYGFDFFRRLVTVLKVISYAPSIAQLRNTKFNNGLVIHNAEHSLGMSEKNHPVTPVLIGGTFDLRDPVALENTSGSGELDFWGFYEILDDLVVRFSDQSKAAVDVSSDTTSSSSCLSSPSIKGFSNIFNDEDCVGVYKNQPDPRNPPLTEGDTKRTNVSSTGIPTARSTVSVEPSRESQRSIRPSDESNRYFDQLREVLQSMQATAPDFSDDENDDMDDADSNDLMSSINALTTLSQAVGAQSLGGNKSSMGVMKMDEKTYMDFVLKVFTVRSPHSGPSEDSDDDDEIVGLGSILGSVKVMQIAHELGIDVAGMGGVSASRRSRPAPPPMRRNSKSSVKLEVSDHAKKLLVFHSMFLIPQQVEVLFIFSTLLNGRRRLDVQNRLKHLRFDNLLLQLWNRMSWEHDGCNGGGIDCDTELDDSSSYSSNSNWIRNVVVSTRFKEEDQLNSKKKNGKCSKTVENALRIQYLRLVHDYSDRDFFNNPLKPSFLSELEQCVLQHSMELSVRNSGNFNYSAACYGIEGSFGDDYLYKVAFPQTTYTEVCAHRAKKNSKITRAVDPIRTFLSNKGLLCHCILGLMLEEPDSSFRFWFCSCIESFLRGSQPIERLFVAKSGLLRCLIEQIMIGHRHKNIEVRKPLNRKTEEEMKVLSIYIDDQTAEEEFDAPSYRLQSAFDLLCELVKFNPGNLMLVENILRECVEYLNEDGLCRIAECMSDNAFSFIDVLADNVVETNVFLRSLYLTLYDVEGQVGVCGDVEGETPTFLTHTWLQFAPEKVSESSNEEVSSKWRCRLDQIQPLCASANYPILDSVLMKNRVLFLYKLCTAITISNISNENLCCVNSVLVILFLANKRGELSGLLNELRTYQYPGKIFQLSGRNVGNTESPVMVNLRELLWYWGVYYRRGRDKLSLEFCTHIAFEVWLSFVNILCSDNYHVVHSPLALLARPILLPVSPYEAYYSGSSKSGRCLLLHAVGQFATNTGCGLWTKDNPVNKVNLLHHQYEKISRENE